MIPKATAEPTADCPECGGAKVARRFGVPVAKTVEATNCRGDGPPCGAVGCGRARTPFG